MVPSIHLSFATRQVPAAGIRPCRIMCLLCVLLLGTSCDRGATTPEKTVVPAETATPQATPEPAAGFDYPGGWRDATSCVDICGVTPDSPVARPAAVVCFNPQDETCAAKTGDNDFDYLLFSQQWLPAMCAGLEAGYDTTVTHRAGARCLEDAPSRLTVHGLWPNYTAGFPQCCGEPLPLDPEQVRAWPSELRQAMASEWLDPTTSGFEEAICEISNHEWQKHGTCAVSDVPTSGTTEPADRGAQQYFTAGLDLAQRLAEATRTIDGWAGSTRSNAEIRGLYQTSIQLLCDSAKPENLLEIHSCWSRDHDAIDCPPAKGFGHLAPCGDQVTLPVL